MEDFIIEEFTSYKVFLLSGLDDVATIHIQIPSGTAVFRFMKSDRITNSVESKNGKNLYKVHASAHQYPHFIDLMRNEGPLFFFYDFKENVSYITTSQEPVGEGEGLMA